MAEQFTTGGIKKAEAAEKYQKDREDAREKQHKAEVRRSFAPAPRQESVRKTLSDREKIVEAQKRKAEDRDKQVKLIKIQKYLTNPHFAFLSELRLRPLGQRPTYDEVCFMYDAIREAIDSKDGPKNVKGYFTSGVGVLEQFWGDGKHLTFLPEEVRFDMRNSTFYIQSGLFDKALDPLANELCIEYPFLASAGLIRRTLSALMGMMATINQLNKTPEAKEQIVAMMAAPPSTDPELAKI